MKSISRRLFVKATSALAVGRLLAWSALDKDSLWLNDCVPIGKPCMYWHDSSISAGDYCVWDIGKQKLLPVNPSGHAFLCRLSNEKSKKEGFMMVQHYAHKSMLKKDSCEELKWK